MTPITLIHKHDQDLKISVALPAGQAGEDAFAEYFDRGGGNNYQACYDFTRACAIEPSGEKLSDLIRIWSGVAIAAANSVYDTLDFDVPTLLDPREVVADYEKHQDKLGMPSKLNLEQWIRQYPRKGPPGKAQCGLADFWFGVVPYRSPEPTEWFAVEGARKSGKAYSVLRSFVQSCVLEDVEHILTNAKTNPLIIPVLGQLIRGAAGEDFAQRMGE